MGWGQEMKTFFRDHGMLADDSRMQKTDTVVKYCEECKQTWESYYCTGKHSETIDHHDLPSIGKDRKNCPSCESKKASELVKYQGV
tara:strand:- start:173 stop:430 length:258 start_codon:yes stop_codon:yes gene_type:complete